MYNVLDIFSGIGGFSLGLDAAGFKTVAFCEMDKNCQKVLRKHWPDTIIYNDVTKLKAKHLKEKIDVICGGFPCQDISIAGKQEGLEGDKSGLWGEHKRLIKEIKPRYAIIENVANLRSKGLNEVIKNLWQIGYDCEWHILPARAFGAVHLRERVFIIAYSNSDELRIEQRRSGGAQGKGPTITRDNGQDGNTTNPDMPRLWRSSWTEETAQRWRATTLTGGNFNKRKLSEIEPTVCRVHDGVSRGLDRPRQERIKQLGNAIVPDIAYMIGKEIMRYERVLDL